MRKINKVKLNPPQILVIGFIVVILIGTLLLNLPLSTQDRVKVGFTNALFTATSAVSVTGLVVKDTATYWSTFGQIVILGLIQIGGLGFMSFVTLIAIIFNKKITYKERILIQESLNHYKIQGVIRYTKFILITSLIIEFVGAILLSIRFIPLYGIKMGVWFSNFHSISAFNNAGFDLMGIPSDKFRSFAPFVTDKFLNMVIMLLIFLGGLGFIVILEIIQKRKSKKMSLHSKLSLVMTGFLLLFGFFVIFILEFNNDLTIGQYTLDNKILASMFQTVTPRTAGFNTLNLKDMNSGSIFFIVILMFIGGSSGSTAGGIKTTTLIILILFTITTIKGNQQTKIFNKRIGTEVIIKSILIFLLSIGLNTTIIFILMITENFSFEEIFFETVSAFGTVGLSLGITPRLSQLGKLVISFTMLAGKVGPMTIFLSFLTKKNKKYPSIKYPEEKIIVG